MWFLLTDAENTIDSDQQILFRKIFMHTILNRQLDFCENKMSGLRQEQVNAETSENLCANAQ